MVKFDGVLTVNARSLINFSIKFYKFFIEFAYKVRN